MQRMAKYSLVFFILLQAFLSGAQTAPQFYWIQFSDKNNTPFSLENPQDFLSEKSIWKRQIFNIPFDSLDLPVDPVYVDGVSNLLGAKLHHQSKWFNAVTVQVEDTLLEESLFAQWSALPYVVQIKKLNESNRESMVVDKNEVPEERKFDTSEFSLSDEYASFYGPSFRQVSMVNAHLLHEFGLTGEGIDVAVFDAGWNRADQLPVFDRLRARNAIVETRDFAFPSNSNVYNLSSHGTYVLSIMAGWMPDSLIGTAPDARYYLFRTENTFSEYIIEEDNWVAAAEYADSLGIDIINSSLGYSEFQDTLQNHTYADMDGNTARSSIAADIAARKGILVVNSAGNSGDDPWRYITAPSDGDSVLCVGAVNADEILASFSSVGPSADGDVKPNVVAMGALTIYADLDSTIRAGNGTSFSSPVVAGAAASLMQAVYGLKNNMEIFHAIERSADHYLNPSDTVGYGVPDFWKALRILKPEWSADIDQKLINVYPNPAQNEINVTTEWLLGNQIETYEIIDASGRIVDRRFTTLSQNLTTGLVSISWSTGQLTHGRYTLVLHTEKETRRAGFVVYY